MLKIFQIIPMQLIYTLGKMVLPFITLLSCHLISSSAQKTKEQENEKYLQQKQHWVDSVYQSLSPEQRIGQLFMVAAYSGGEKYNEPLISKLIAENYIGGLIFMQGTAENQARLTNQYQAKSKIPLLIGMDAEWGLGMRLTGVEGYPRQMMLGATRDEKLVYEMGTLVAAQCKLMGVHINFAPDIDINNNPKNPVINFRSFGEDKNWVAKLGLAYMKGMQDNKVLACAKHFPGHGDVDVDSHLDLPVVNKSKADLEALELYPFKVLADSGVASVMIAHLAIPQLDSAAHVPTTLSHNVVTQLLKNEIGFKGLIITDALNMEGVAKFYKPGEVDVKAFEAGNDILLFSQDVPLAVNKIQEKLVSGKISEERLAHSVKKILAAKYEVGLNIRPVITDTLNLTARLNQAIPAFRSKVAKAALTLVKDEFSIVGSLNESKKVAYFSVDAKSDAFINILKATTPQVKVIGNLNDVKQYDVVIVGVHQLSFYPGKSGTYGLSATALNNMQKAAQLPNAMICVFGNAYVAQFAKGAKGLMIAYEDNEATYQAFLEALQGKWKPTGVLPVLIP